MTHVSIARGVWQLPGGLMGISRRMRCVFLLVETVSKRAERPVAHDSNGGHGSKEEHLHALALVHSG